MLLNHWVTRGHGLVRRWRSIDMVGDMHSKLYNLLLLQSLKTANDYFLMTYRHFASEQHGSAGCFDDGESIVENEEVKSAWSDSVLIDEQQHDLTLILDD